MIGTPSLRSYPAVASSAKGVLAPAGLDVAGTTWYVPGMSAPRLQTSTLPTLEPTPAVRPRRHWRAKFGDAFRGLKFGIRGHSSFAVHFFFTAVVLLAAAVLRCSLEEWCLLLLAVGLVLTA